MPGISEKILFLAGGSSVKSWAEKHDLPGQTVHDWVKHGRMPSAGNLKLLIQATGKPKEWWLDESLTLKSYKTNDEVNQRSDSFLNEPPATYEETLQYDEFKVYRDNVVKLNAKPKMWLEDIVNYFVSLPEEEQEKISIYSKDLYDKVTNLEKRKHLNVTISGIVEIPMPEQDNRGNTNESSKFKSQRRQNSKHSKLHKR